MARPASPRPTDGELAILQVLWRSGGSTIRQIQDALRDTRPIGYTTVQSNLRTMIHKHLVRRDHSGAGSVYRAAGSEESVRRELLNELADKAFGGSVANLIREALAVQKSPPRPDNAKSRKRNASQ